MERAITLPDLKKRLKTMDRNYLEKLIYEMYKQNPTVQQLVNVELLGQEYEERLLEEYDTKLKKIFYPKNIVVTGFSPIAAKNVLKEFLDICKDDRLKAKAKLNFVTYGIDLIETYGGADEKLYDYIFDYFDEIIKYASKDKIFLDENNVFICKLVILAEDYGYENDKWHSFSEI